MFYKKFKLNQYELLLAYKRGVLVDVKEIDTFVTVPILDWLRGKRYEVYDQRLEQFYSADLATEVKLPQLAKYLTVVDLKDNERAIVKRNGRVAEVLGPGLYAYFKFPQLIEVNIYDVTQPRLNFTPLDALLKADNASAFISMIDIAPGSTALLYQDGQLIEQLKPGRYAYWKDAGKIAYQSYDLRQMLIDVNGQEIMTADKVSLRVNLLVNYRVAEPLVVAEQVDDPKQAVYRDAQLVLREAIGTRLLDDLLADKQSLADELTVALKDRAAKIGLAIDSVGVRDLILPGDMKSLFNQVIEAEKSAQANLIQRREETAAARSQANTAKLYEQTPTLMKLKELEAIERIFAYSNVKLTLAPTDLLAQFRALTNPDQTTDP